LWNPRDTSKRCGSDPIDRPEKPTTFSAEIEVMSTAKEKMFEIIRSQPDDASYEEIMRELAFERMVDHGLEDARQGRVLPDEEIKQRLRTWRK
jgi:predicted transcriptional regulator